VHTQTNYDVLICGAGLAGLSLARHLKLQLPALSIAVVDRLPRPLPEAAHKVGEASNDLGAYYFGIVLRLQDYLRRAHLRKLAVRFFFGDPHGPFENRPELGPSLYPPMPTYQLDRGRLENDLRRMVSDMGVALFEAATVDDVVLAEGAQPHAVQCRRDDGPPFMLFGRWLVDALGRRRLLQSKLGLAKPNGHAASAAWWRIQPPLDIRQMGAAGGRAWQERVIEDRNLSTNHLMGRGYWIWLIPLSSGATSVGIVTDETIHPSRAYGKSYSHALEWLREHEPSLWQSIKDRELLDFHRLKNFSYHAQQIFSHHRWSCVGEAGVFLDPLYSIGSDIIAVTNTLTVEMIRRDLQGELTETAVDEFNRVVLDCFVPHALAYYKDTYGTFGHAHICVAKVAWDLATYQGILCQLYFQNIIQRPTPEVFALLRQYNELNERVQRLLIDWAKAAPSRAPCVALSDLTRMPIQQLLHLDMAARRTMEQFLQVARLNLDRLEEIAQILFWQAVEECLPEHMPKDRRSLPWINAWRMSLAPERWQTDGLYYPFTAPRSLRPMRVTFAGIFAPITWREIFQVELVYRLRHVARGKPATFLIGLLQRHLIRNKPAMWLRRLLVTDRPSRRPARLSGSTARHRRMKGTG